jgi:hypothetical protein
MKVVANGGLHCSILSMAGGTRLILRKPASPSARARFTRTTTRKTWVEGLALFDMLEKEVVPRFYRRGEDGIPPRLGADDESLHQAQRAQV